jgi:hypothetical protein
MNLELEGDAFYLFVAVVMILTGVTIEHLLRKEYRKYDKKKKP